MALTDKQKLGKCCGIFCSFLACLNIWFFAMITVFQSMNSPYMKIKLEEFTQVSEDSSNWTVAFAITVGVSQFIFLTCEFSLTWFACSLAFSAQNATAIEIRMKCNITTHIPQVTEAAEWSRQPILTTTVTKRTRQLQVPNAGNRWHLQVLRWKYDLVLK